MVSFCWSFWIRIVYPFDIDSNILAFSRHLTPFKNQFVMDRGDLLKPESMYAIMTWCFSIGTFLSVVLSDFMCMSTSGFSLNSCNSFLHAIYPFDLSVMFFLFLYFTPKLFDFHCIQFFCQYILIYLFQMNSQTRRLEFLVLNSNNCNTFTVCKKWLVLNRTISVK